MLRTSQDPANVYTAFGYLLPYRYRAAVLYLKAISGAEPHGVGTRRSVKRVWELSRENRSPLIMVAVNFLP